MASRKNFPNRVEARRQRALNRSARAGGPNGEAPQAVPHSAPVEGSTGASSGRQAATQRHPQLQRQLGDEFGVGGMTGQAGYVYVLLTGYTDKTGVPLVKIGCTSRTPDQRNREISRGGPVGTSVVGAVTTRDMVALELWPDCRIQTQPTEGLSRTWRR
jgi:hypothetical protein